MKRDEKDQETCIGDADAIFVSYIHAIGGEIESKGT